MSTLHEHTAWILQAGDIYQYFWSADTKDKLFPEPKLVTCDQDMVDILEKVESTDIIDHLSQRRPDTKWRFVMAANMRITLFHLLDHPIGAYGPKLPEHLLACNGVVSLLYDNKRNMMKHPDCFFRCLATHLNNNKVPDKFQTEVDRLKAKYKAMWKLPANFKGDVKLTDLTKLETTFQVRVSVFHMESAETCTVVRRSPVRQKTINGDMKLDLTNKHFSLIRNMAIYCKSWKCTKCDNFITKWAISLKRHLQDCSGRFEPKVKYRAGRFYCFPTLFDRLEKMGIVADEVQRYSESFTCWDLESAPVPVGDGDPQQGKCLTYEDRQVAIACAICSNVDGYTEDICLKLDYDSDPQELVKEMLDYFLEISAVSAEQERIRMQSIFDQLEEEIAKHESEAEDSNESISGHHKHMLKIYENLKESLEAHCDNHVLFTFNGGNVDDDDDDDDNDDDDDLCFSKVRQPSHLRRSGERNQGEGHGNLSDHQETGRLHSPEDGWAHLSGLQHNAGCRDQPGPVHGITRIQRGQAHVSLELVHQYGKGDEQLLLSIVSSVTLTLYFS